MQVSVDGSIFNAGWPVALSDSDRYFTGVTVGNIDNAIPGDEIIAASR